MEFTASHRFTRPLDEVSAAFLDADAHVGRYDLAGDRDIEILSVEAGDDLPALTTGRADGACTGRSQIEASNVPGTATIAATIKPDGEDACAYTIVLTLALKVPLIGDRFVALMRPKVMEIIDAEFEAWDRWFAGTDAA